MASLNKNNSICIGREMHMQRCGRQAGAFSPSVLVLILTTIPKQLHALRTPLGGGSIGRGGGGNEELI